ncbi:hypothetical protein DRO69_04390 [Candidatus Bathyarchaeota archaeon]|nr:MAG: hypothetical protein DRO69_04390 [Candidatus Bathyarchaeota archaeon]
MTNDILNMRNPHLTYRQGNRMLEVFIASCPCCGKKRIIVRGDGTIDFALEEAERFVEDFRKVIMVAKTHP